jgi:hypothetical protein
MGGACGIVGNIRNVCNVLIGKPRKRYSLGYLDIDGSITLKEVLNREGLCDLNLSG